MEGEKETEVKLEIKKWLKKIQMIQEN
jgi:hypothetical protein